MANSTSSTAITAVAWIVGLFLAIKLLPGLLRGNGGTPNYGGFPNLNPYGQSYPGQVGPGPGGIYPAGQIPLSQALTLNGLSPDSAQAFAGVYDVQNGYNYNGSPLSAAQQSALTPTDTGIGASLGIPYQDSSPIPDSFYTQETPGAGSDSSIDASDAFIYSDPSDLASYIGDEPDPFSYN